jgi:Asp-tRNA(Asn)/Glu-tRNA(Gln) amidotransferase A subunit family amidase
MPFYPKRDSAGPITRTAADLAYAMNALALNDPQNPHKDPKRPKKMPDFRKSLIPHLRGLRIGVIGMKAKPDPTEPSEIFQDRSWRGVVQKLKALGATLVEEEFDAELLDAIEKEWPRHASVRSLMSRGRQRI